MSVPTTWAVASLSVGVFGAVSPELSFSTLFVCSLFIIFLGGGLLVVFGS